MKPILLKMCAWGPYRDKEEVDFTKFYERGIFLITGATGAGKTTIFDAITYALYGALSGTERDKERNSIRSDFADAGTPTYVELTMEHAGGEYLIRRNPEYLRPKKRGDGEGYTKEKENAVLSFPDGRVLEGSREVNAALLELLSLDCQQFKRISMIAQGEFARLLVAPPREKTGIFREIFGTGMYEKFTRELGERSRELYARVMKHQDKLEEDIRLLKSGMKEGIWEEAFLERLTELTSRENWNYEEIDGCVAEMEEHAKKSALLARKEFEEKDRILEKQVKSISAWEEENRRVSEFLSAEKKLQALEEKEQMFREKEERYRKSINAAFAAGAEEKAKGLETQLAENGREFDRRKKEILSLRQEEKELAPMIERTEQLEALLEEAKLREKLEREYFLLQEQYIRQKAQLKQEEGAYLEKERNYRELRERYDEADRKRRLAAVGLAAALLKEGEPCPVCGSLTHPSPAAVEEDVASQEEIDRLKEESLQAEEDMRKLHEKLLGQKGGFERLTEQLQEKSVRLQESAGKLEAEEEPVCKRFLHMETSEAERLLKSSRSRAGELTGLLQEMERTMERLAKQQEYLTGEKEKAGAAFAEIMHKYGFHDMASYEKAKLSETEREKLQQEIKAYREQLAACREVYVHLQEGLKGRRTLADLAEAKETLSMLRKEKELALKKHRKWEQQLAETVKTRRLKEERQRAMEDDRREYGYVKELENMANGNNAKRLVFEQYVLAGYFEEILRAANLRFNKMTSGRYEMSRVNEVGDGRVKDNLEIQVLDNYTGKYRSVRTLSGGETFKASLCLALGMSDVIQAMNGGIRVDTLFVDEGFGALDDESLEQACSALTGLAGKNCLIGIISHVPQLRERIGAQLVIEKTGSGSRIKNGI